MKKALSLIIVIALLATQFVFPAFAEDSTIKSVTITATRDLVAYYDGDWGVEYDEEENEIPVFVYSTENADLWFEIEFADGETFEGDMWDTSANFDIGFFYDSIARAEDEDHIGTYEVEISCEYFTETVEIKIVENPVKSVEAVATKTLIKNWNGSLVEYCEGDECVEYFYYDMYQAYPYYTITYKDGTVYEGYDEEIWEQTGYYPYDVETQEEKPWNVGKNKAKASFLGVECEFEVEVVETPIKSIVAETTYPLYENYSGYWAEIDDGEKDYFEYSVMDSVPVFTVTFKDGEEIKGNADDIAYELDEYFAIVDDQYKNPWQLGTNTANFVFMGFEFSVSVEVVKDTVVSVSGEPMTYLIENHNGFWQTYYDEKGDEIDYFWYDTDEAAPMFTITYKDGSTFTGTGEEIYLETGVWVYDETEQGEKPWVVGDNTAQMSYLGHEFEVVFVVAESPVESVVITEENGLTLEIKYRDDDEATKAKVIDFLVVINEYDLKTYLVTADAQYECTYYVSGDEGAEEFYISILGVESNRLDNCNWITATMCADSVAYSALVYATGSEELFGKKFTGYNSADEEKDLTQMVALAIYLCEYEPEMKEPYFYHNLSTDIINEDLEAVFGVTFEDFADVDGYNDETDMVEIYEPINAVYDYNATDMNFVDGKWEKIYRVENLETGKVDVLKVVLNGDMTIDRILFRMKGDVTGDGKVSAIDARWILQNVAMSKTFDESQKLVADVNGDGKIGAIDARGVLQFAAGTKEF